jgi:uncharacterized protein YbbC (DUF1343 family)
VYKRQPWLAAHTLADKLNQQELPGVVVRAVQFTPTASKYAGQLCQGMMLHVLDEQRFRPVATGLHLLSTIMKEHPAQFQWLPYPTADSGAGYGHFDRLIGQLWVREALEKGGGRDESIAQWTDVGKWTARVEPYLLYH